MSRATLGNAAVVIGLLTVPLLVVLVLRLVRTGAALDAYVLAVGAVVLATLVHATRAIDRGAHSHFEAALHRRPEPPERPPELSRLERVVFLAGGSAFYLHYRLRPVLRQIAEHRLRSHRGLELDGGREAVREAVGEDWELLRPDRPAPRDPHGPGLPAAQLRAVVDRLERL